MRVLAFITVRCVAAVDVDDPRGPAMRIRDRLALLFGVGAALLLVASGAGQAQSSRFSPPIFVPSPLTGLDDGFGYNPIIVGDRVFVTSYRRANGEFRTRIYGYLLNGTPVLKIDHPVPGGGFGALAPFGDKFLAQSRPGGSNPSIAPSVYVFDARTGAQLLKIDDPDPAPGGDGSGIGARQFGDALLGLPGNLFAVGSPFYGWGAQDRTTERGVYIFDGTTGELVYTISRRMRFTEPSFSRTLAYAGGLLAVGLPQADRVELFSLSGVPRGAVINTPQAILQNPAPTLVNNFGFSLAGDGGRLLVGAPFRTFPAASTGMAFFYDVAAPGAPIQTLTLAANPREFFDFGRTLAMVDGDPLVAAPNGWLTVQQSGGLFLFDSDQNGALVETFAPPPPNTNSIYHIFGRFMSAAGANFAVGSPYALDQFQGGANGLYIYLAADYCTAPRRRLPSPNMNGGAPRSTLMSDLDGDGIGDVCDQCPNDAGNDPDYDGICASVDNCPMIANADQGDADGDRLRLRSRFGQ